MRKKKLTILFTSLFSLLVLASCATSTEAVVITSEDQFASVITDLGVGSTSSYQISTPTVASNGVVTYGLTKEGYSIYDNYAYIKSDASTTTTNLIYSYQDIEYVLELVKSSSSKTGVISYYDESSFDDTQYLAAVDSNEAIYNKSIEFYDKIQEIFAYTSQELASEGYASKSVLRSLYKDYIVYTCLTTRIEDGSQENYYVTIDTSVEGNIISSSTKTLVTTDSVVTTYSCSFSIDKENTTIDPTTLSFNEYTFKFLIDDIDAGVSLK